MIQTVLDSSGEPKALGDEGPTASSEIGCQVQ